MTYGERQTGSEALPLLKGTVDLLVLKALTLGPMHGFGIALWLEEHSSGTLNMDDSATYQVLHRLESKDLVSAEWGVTENNRKARYYRLTAAGRKHLRAETEMWLRYTRSVTSILTLDPRAARA
ncbi:MAG TPA: PadR family transcriptional regulator [Gemmatimonadaceae bacterium]|jgi:PadR family transcriptional regulator PadR|nr:PadR family transcriptional regulator [Gemmatimonadaceae bacterium]